MSSDWIDLNTAHAMFPANVRPSYRSLQRWVSQGRKKHRREIIQIDSTRFGNALAVRRGDIARLALTLLNN